MDEMGRFGYGTKEVLYPRFRKIEQVYRKKYNQRSRKHQLIYYAGFVMIYSVSFPFLIIVAMFVTEVVKSMIGENSGGVIIGVFIISILLLFTLVYGKLQSYKRNYAKWFNLEIIMWEYGHPVSFEKRSESNLASFLMNFGYPDQYLLHFDKFHKLFDKNNYFFDKDNCQKEKEVLQ
ncbi:hypothetical protein [Streptococcus suis]